MARRRGGGVVVWANRLRALPSPPSESSFRTRGVIVSRSVYVVRQPRVSYLVTPLLSLVGATPELKSIH